MKSFNNKLILEPYKGDRKIQASVKSGFATVKQKDTLVGLKLLIDAFVIMDGIEKTIKKGSVAYISEEILFTHTVYQKQYDCNVINEKFIIVDLSVVSFIGESNEN